MKRRLLTIAGAALAAAMGVQIHSAAAFNTHNGTDFPICVRSNDHGGYFEEVWPGQTSKGWAIDKSMNLEVAVLDVYTCSDEECTSFNVSCNSYMTSCQTAPHAQQVVSDIHFQPGDPRSSTLQEAAFAAMLPASFTASCNN